MNRSQILAITLALIVGLGGSWAIAAVQDNQRTRYQCQQLVDRINQGYAQTLAFQGTDAIALNRLAEQLNAIANSLQQIDIDRPPLRRAQQQFVQGYRDLSQGYQGIVRALDAADQAPKTETGLQQVQQAQSQVKEAGAAAQEAARQIDQFARDLNRLCLGGE
jgi:DNA repair ATPase RecN